MGKLISFWSPYPGHGKATSSLCAVLGGFLLQYPDLSIAVSHTQKDPGILLKKLDCDVAAWNEKGWLDSFGTGALKMYGRQNALLSENIRRCGLPVYGKQCLFYPNNMKYESNGREAFLFLAEQLKKEFNLLLLDLKSGNKEEALRYMEKSDYVIIVLPQDPFYVDLFMKEEMECFSEINFGMIFGGYLPKSQYRSTFYKKEYGNSFWDGFLGEIPWNGDFFDAMSAGKTMDFFFRNYAPVKKEENYDFIFQIKKTTERIRKNSIG